MRKCGKVEGGLFTVENMKLQFPFTNVDKKLNHFQVTLQKAYLHVVYWWQHRLGMASKTDSCTAPSVGH